MNRLLERARGIRNICKRCRPDQRVEVFLVREPDTPVKFYAFIEGHDGVRAAARMGSRVARLTHHSTIPQIYTALNQAVDGGVN